MKFNLFDAALLAAFAALLWAAYTFSAPQVMANDGGQKIRYVIELGEKREGFSQGIRAGAAVYDSLKSYAIGTVVSAYGLPYWVDSPDEEGGVFRRAYVEGLEFTYVVVEAIAWVDDYQTAVGQYPVAVNNEVFVRSKDFAGQGFITSLEFIGG